MVAARTFLESVEQGRPSDGDAWHAAYGRAEEVAERAVAVLARLGAAGRGNIRA